LNIEAWSTRTIKRCIKHRFDGAYRPSLTSDDRATVALGNRDQQDRFASSLGRLNKNRIGLPYKGFHQIGG
jgi:hypothetical protein